MALPTFPHFDVHADSSVGPRWTKWLVRFERLMIAMDIADNTRKQALLLHYAGPEVDEIFDTLAIADPVDPANSYSVVADALSAYFTPKVNTTFEVYNFRQAAQNDGETIDSFVTRLRRLAKSCGFADESNEIASQIIFSCKSQALRRRALREDLKLDDLIKAARAMALSDNQAKTLESHSLPETANVVKFRQQNNGRNYYEKRQPSRNRSDSRRRLDKSQPNQSTESRKRQSGTCAYCGYTLPHHTCPARGKTCSACGKRDHFAKVCRSSANTNSAANTVTMQSRTSAEYDSDAPDYVFRATTKSPLPSCTIRISGQLIKMTIDSGASVNIIDQPTYNALPTKPPLKTASVSVFPYGSKTPLPVLGVADITLHHKSSHLDAQLHVVRGSGGNLLGCRAAQDLGILLIANNISSNLKSNSFTGDFPDLFSGGIGRLKDKIVKLHVDEAVPPKHQPHRRIPFHVRQDVEKAIARLEAQNIIEKASGPTPWVSPIVVVPKKTGEVRICVDMREANKAIMREKHLMPTLDDLISDLNGAKYFTTLDLLSGYHQLELHPDSRYITTFSTHVGLFRYKRLMFGVNSASEIFQHAVAEILQGLPGVKNISDDILIYGKSIADHDRHLRAVLQRLQLNNARLNLQKCRFTQPTVTFYGHIFGGSGIRADPRKIDAIKNAPRPNNVSEVRSLLGMAQYVARFIPNFTCITAPLRQLTRQSCPWKWTNSEDESLKKLSDALTQAPAMTYFDPHQRSHLLVDASPTGLGAILTQDGKVICYGSRALTDVESRYSQTEREMLAVVWGAEHFHIYLFGAEFDISTDHQPLLGIIKSRRPVSARLERWRIRLTPYKFELKYRPGRNENNPADYISRHPTLTPSFSDLVEEHVSYLCLNAVPKAMSTSQVVNATADDPALQAVISTMSSNKWSDPAVKNFINIRRELAVLNGIVLRGDRIVLPASLQQHAIDLAHMGHQGIVRTKRLLREKIWFPQMDSMVEETIKKCLACQTVTTTSNFVPLQPSQLPAAPWENVSCDFLGPLPSGEYLLVTMDDYSRFPEVEVIKSTSSRTVMPKLDNIFSRQGIPKVLKSDNGPPFNGDDFSQFATYLGFKHQKITPRWPRANGEVERFMRPLMKVIRAAHVEGKNWRQELYRFLRQYRATPHSSTDVSPAEALNGRKLRTTLPDLSQQPTDLRELHGKIKQTDINSKQNAKLYWDAQHSAKHSQIKVGDTVLVKQSRKNKLSTPYDPQPLTVTNVKGSMITARHNSHNITRNASHFKPFLGDAPRTSNSSEPEDYDNLFGPIEPAALTDPSSPTQLRPCFRDSTAPRTSSRVRFVPQHLNDYVGLPKTMGMQS